MKLNKLSASSYHKIYFREIFVYTPITIGCGNGCIQTFPVDVMYFDDTGMHTEGMRYNVKRKILDKWKKVRWDMNRRIYL